MNIKEFLMILEWYGISEGEAGVDLEERKRWHVYLSNCRQKIKSPFRENTRSAFTIF